MTGNAIWDGSMAFRCDCPAYENKHYPIGPADPIEAIKFRMEQQGLAAKDLEPFIGSSGRVSEVLNRKRALSLRMVKRLHDGLKIPYESLLSDVAGSSAPHLSGDIKV